MEREKGVRSKKPPLMNFLPSFFLSPPASIPQSTFEAPLRLCNSFFFSSEYRSGKKEVVQSFTKRVAEAHFEIFRANSATLALFVHASMYSSHAPTHLGLARLRTESLATLSLIRPQPRGDPTRPDPKERPPSSLTSLARRTRPHDY